MFGIKCYICRRFSIFIMLRNLLKKLIFVFLLTLCGMSCQRQNTGFLLLTFDDSSADAWVAEAAPLLLKNGASATFYVSQFYELNEAQRQKIASLQKMGFEIGYHSTNHLNTQEYLATNTLDSFWRTQILPDLRLLHRYGIYPKNYAHPFCATDRKSTRLNSSHRNTSRMPSSA